MMTNDNCSCEILKRIVWKEIVDIFRAVGETILDYDKVKTNQRQIISNIVSISLIVEFIDELKDSLPIDRDGLMEDAIKLLENFRDALKNQNIEKINEFRLLIEETPLNILVKRYKGYEITEFIPMQEVFYNQDLEILKNFLRSL